MNASSSENVMFQWQMTETDKEFSLVQVQLPQAAPGQAVVQISGCGVCHTDLSFWHYGVQTKHTLPLTLGHEISGVVVAGDPEWIGKNVIVPAVLPCGECDLCENGRSNICRNQTMPGNDFHGGFASHIIVPSRFLCAVPDSVLARFPLSHLAVIADAISTPYQVVAKSELRAGDLAIVIGVGGVGIYAALIARILGAKVLALDISDAKLQIAKDNGIEATLNTADMDIKAVKDNVKTIARGLGVPQTGWKIFEMSGTKAGQELGFNLLTFASTMSVVGFTMDKADVRLSNLMAFDAKLIGTWGCRAELYPEVLNLIETGKLNIAPFVETKPMSEINDVFRNSLQHLYTKRIVLVPDFNNN